MAVPTEFAHLHVASSYSLRYGTATPAALAARAAGLGMPVLALTDRDGLYGAFKHIQACADAGIKPLLGADLGLRTDDRINGVSRVTLLATGRQGWASLCRLVSAALATSATEATEATEAVRATKAAKAAGGARAAADDVPAVTRELIAEHADGLVMLLGPASDVGQAVAARRPDLARHALDRWRHLGVDAVVEIVDHLDHKSTFRAARLAELARDTRTPAVLTNAVRYLDPVDSLAAQVLDAARHLVPLGSPKLVPHNGRAYLASQEDMTATARRVAAAMTGPGTASAATLLLGETEELTRKCTLDPARDLGVGSRHLPETKGTAYDQHKELRDRCEHAILHGRYRTASAASRPRGVSRLRAAETARERLEHELDIIAQTGMAAYFLTVADITDRIRHAGIRCAVRGSGAGSFVNHLLGISAIDPLEHDLLIERFLSPVRNTLPDIDLDVESARRLDAYRIIFDRYGKERTACVCMMETYRARSAIRDVAAAMSLPPDEIGAIAKSFPHIRAKHITAALTELPELRRSRLDSTQITTIFSIAQQLDGLPRHVAMHPCGVLLSDKTLLDRTAVQESGEGFPLSQLDKDDAEIAGVIKLDVLGVRMQSAMAHALTEIERTENERIDIDAMPRDDPATYAMIQRSETLGCFQIESPGQRELVKKLAPRDIADLIVDISLFRPGPVNSDMIGPFLRTRHGLAEPRYPHEKLEKALKETGGVVVFHEQVLRVIDAMTGCGLAEADLVRRHLSTEGGPDRTAPWFRAQALASGFDPVTVERVWQVVAAFGGFGFCKAHAAAFAIPVYQSAWLRRHHPAAFYAGVLTHEPGMYPKRVIIADARLSGVQILPVDINASSGDWAVVSRGGDPPYPPLSVRSGLIAKTAIVSGPPARTNVPRGDTVRDTPDPDGPYFPGKESNPSSRTTAASSSPPHSPPGVPPADGLGGARSMTSFQRPGSPASAPARAGSTSEGSPSSDMSAGPAADDSPPGQSRAGRRFLESSGPLQALRFPGRSYLPGGHSAPWGHPRPRPPVPPAVRAVGPDRKNRDHIRPARTDGDLPAAASPQAIRCSLREVKGISDAEITRIVAGQPYTGLRDFWNRAGASRPVTERLVLIGAFDSLYTSAPSAGAQPLPQPPGILAGKMSANCRVPPHSPAALSSSASSPSQVSPEPLWLSAPTPDISDMPGRRLAPGRRAPALPRPSRRDLLARVGVLARQSAPVRHGSPAALDLFADASAEAADGMADLVPAGELRDLDLTERVAAELEILGFELSQHVLHFYADLLAGLGVVRSAELADRENGEMILVAGAKVATQTPAVRSGQRIIFASLDDAAGLVDLAFFESVQDRCAARLFASWLLLVRGRVRRAGAGPMAVTVNATECWDLPALEEIREAGGMAAVHAAMAAGDAGPGTHLARLPDPGTSPNSAGPTDSAGPADPVNSNGPVRPVVFANGFTLSPYAETGGPGGNLKHPSRTLWHASPGSTSTPDALADQPRCRRIGAQVAPLG